MRKAYASLLLALAASAHADTAECERHMLSSYPFSHRPTAEQTQALKDCNADNLYYGIGLHFDYVRARHCAFTKGNHDVLMMLYANGYGVPRNYPMAKMAACRAEAAPAETESRLAHLARMQSGREGPSPKIDICDDATSGLLGGRCAVIRSGLKEQEREGRIESLITRWSADEKQAFQQLRKHAEAFFAARSNGEVDRPGTLRTAFVMEERDALIEDWLDSLRAFEAGKLPANSQEDFAKADRELNQALQKLKARPDQRYQGAVKFEDISEAQRTWLAYRDAWVAFGKVRYPAVAPHAWKAYFTQKRTAMLVKLSALRD